MTHSKICKEQAWSEREFEQVNLGDKRLNDRLKQIAEDLSAAPEAPINQASEDWAATKAAYRFFQNEKVTSGQILRPHQARTRERMSQESIVLAIQDTSYLNFSSHKRTRGLGPILTFPVKSVLQAANLHRGRVILTNLATVPGYQWVFYFDVRGSRQDEQQLQQPN